jgi:CRP-like cAMP-binding protein
MGRKLDSILDFFGMSWKWFKKKRDALINLTDSEKQLLYFSVFSSLGKSQIKSINSIIFERTFKSNEIIFKIGHPNIVMYFILEGEVDLYDSEDSDVPDMTIGEGGLVGSLEIFTGSTRASTAVAKTKCKMLAMSKYDFRNMIKNNPRIGSKILYAFCEKYSNSLYTKIVEDKGNAEKK